MASTLTSAKGSEKAFYSRAALLTLESVDTQAIHAHLLTRQRMPYCHAFMYDVPFGRVGTGRLVCLDELDQGASYRVSDYLDNVRMMINARLFPAVSNTSTPSSIAAFAYPALTIRSARPEAYMKLTSLEG